MEHMGKPCKYLLGLSIIGSFIQQQYTPLQLLLLHLRTLAVEIWLFGLRTLSLDGVGVGGAGADINNYFKYPIQNLSCSFSSSLIPVEPKLGSGVWGVYHNLSTKTKHVP